MTQNGGKPLFERPVPPPLRGLILLVYVVFFLVLPVLGAWLFVLTMQDLEPGPIPDDLSEAVWIWGSAWFVGSLLSGSSLVVSLWTTGLNFARRYTACWSMAFAVVAGTIAFFIVLATLTWPPERPALVVTAFMFLPVVVALPPATVVGLPAAWLLGFVTRALGA